jgi:hypothetical protein
VNTALRSDRVRLVVLAVAVVAVVLGQWMMRNGPSVAATTPWLAGLAIIVWLQWATMSDVVGPDGDARLAPIAAPQRCLLAVAALQALAVALLLHDRPPTADHSLVMIAWLFGLGSLLGAAVWGDRAQLARATTRSSPAWTVRERWAFSGVVLLALTLRSIRLGRYPYPFDGDGAGFARDAQHVIRGSIRDPFSTGYYDHGTLFAYAQSLGMRVLGDDSTTGPIVINVAFGTATVAMVYLLTRRLFGVGPALAAGVLISVFHYHLYMSRVALNNGPDALALVALVYLVDVAFVEGRRTHAVLAGITVGLAQYAYTATKILLPLTVILVVVITMQQRRRPGIVPASSKLFGWLVAGLALAFLPLGLHYWDEPWDWSSRANQVTISAAWLDSEAERTGSSTTDVLARQFRDAALLPFATETTGHYRPGAPLAGVPLAVMAAIGMAVATAASTRRRYAGLAISWWVVLAGVGATIDLRTQRWSAAAPLVPIAAAVGIEAVRRVLMPPLTSVTPVTAQGSLRPRLVASGMAAAVAIAAVWNIGFFFRRSNELRHYGDLNTLVASELAVMLHDEADGTTVYMAALPRMSYTSHNTIQLMAPDVDGHDVETPVTDASRVPAVAGPTIFVFLPERAGELDVVRAVHPGGAVSEVIGPDEQVLYTIYRVDS